MLSAPFRAPFRVVLDANVLHPLNLRDVLLDAACDGEYQLYWSEMILEETRRSLVREGRMSEEKAIRLTDAMASIFPEALVTGYEFLIEAMPNHPDDRHVVAAAVFAGAQVIVTQNLKDFRELPPTIEAQSPDEFLCNILDRDPKRTIERLVQQAARRTRPPIMEMELIHQLGKVVPKFALAAELAFLDVGQTLKA